MARKDFGAKPLCYPQPVFILGTYDANGVPNAMNAAWGGISEAQEISFCISRNHKTTDNILATKAFTVSMANAAHVVGCDYVGIVSGNDDPDKFAHAGFTATEAPQAHAPIINELPICLVCELISYDEESCRLVGHILNVSVDESALTDGKVDVSKAQPITFDPFNNLYHRIGDTVGTAWGSGKALL